MENRVSLVKWSKCGNPEKDYNDGLYTELVITPYPKFRKEGSVGYDDMDIALDDCVKDCLDDFVGSLEDIFELNLEGYRLLIRLEPKP
jgi:hypothetical protein